MKFISIFIKIAFLSLIVNSCNHYAEVNCHEIKIKNGRGIYNFRLYSGICKSYYLSGETQWIIHWDKGKQHGLRSELYKNGQLKTRYFIENGVPNGDFISYFENDNVEYKGYINNGKKDGVWKLWSPTGQLIETVNWVQGVKYN